MGIGGIIIWLLCCGLCSGAFGAISLWARRRKEPMHFWSGEEIPADAITDIPAWNRGHSRMWRLYAIAFGVTGLLGFAGTMAAVTAMMLCCTVGIAALLMENNRLRKLYYRPKKP